MTDSAFPSIDVSGSKGYIGAVFKQLRALAGRQVSKTIVAAIETTKTYLFIEKYPGAIDNGAMPDDVKAATPDGTEVKYTNGKTVTEPDIVIDPEWGPVVNPYKRPMLGKGTASDTTIYYFPWLYLKGKRVYAAVPWYLPDEILLHEMVHGLRHMLGLRQCDAMGDGYQNKEEFFGILITNIYRSALKRSGLRGSHVDKKPLGAKLATSDAYYEKYKKEINQLRREMPEVCKAIAAVEAKYNPLAAAYAADGRAAVAALKSMTTKTPGVLVVRADKYGLFGWQFEGKEKNYAGRVRFPQRLQ